MPTPTYTLIQEQVLGSNQASVTFSSIPQTYKDLEIEIIGTYVSGAANITFRFNGDAGSNYSATQLYGYSTTAASARYSNLTYQFSRGFSTTICLNKIKIFQYANTNIFKTNITQGGQDSQYDIFVNMWRSTSAINTITFADFSGTATFSSGSIFRLWGIVG